MSAELRILVVDDDRVDRMAVRRALRAAGMQCSFTEAVSVEEALAALAEEGFDLVFLDFQLPGGDGLSVLQRARAGGFSAPIIVLTGQGDDQVAVQLMKAGASDYLTKSSLTPERLDQTVRSVLRVHQAEEQARQAESRLRASEARFRILHETSPDGFMIFRSLRDEKGEIDDFIWEYTNPAAERMSRRSAESLRGKRLVEVMPRVLEVGLFDLYCEVVEQGEPREVEVLYDPEMDVWYRITAAKLEDGFAVSFTDISPRKRAEDERERAIATRSRFYAAMSHELRTPINAILGYTDLLLLGAYGSLVPQQQEGIERTYRAAQHLLELVNDVLDLSKLEAGKLEIQLEPVLIPELVEDLFTTVMPLAGDSGTELRFSHTGCDDPVDSDPRRLRQILLNLISNAIKFGGTHPVEVRCESLNGLGIAIDVIDQGPGIPQKDLSRIFEEFVQLGGTEQRGTGLGLPISRRLAQLLGGSLEAESREGQGSRFRLTLPTAATEVASSPPLAMEV
jgi:signal transduction histidine kinase